MIWWDPCQNQKGATNTYLHNIDEATRWPEAVALRSIQARPVVEALLEIFSFLQYSRSDHTTLYGISKVEMSPYHPQSNRLVERLHGTLVRLLKKCIESKSDWLKFLPMALCAIRLVPNSSTGYSPFMLVHGRELHSPIDLIHRCQLSQNSFGDTGHTPATPTNLTHSMLFVMWTRISYIMRIQKVS